MQETSPQPRLTVQRVTALGYPLVGFAWLATMIVLIADRWRLAPVVGFVSLLVLVFKGFNCPRCGAPLAVVSGLAPLSARKTCLRCGLDFSRQPYWAQNRLLRAEWVSKHGANSARFLANLNWLLFGRLPKDF